MRRYFRLARPLFFAALLAMLTTPVLARSPLAEPEKIGIELNRLEDQAGNCRAYLVIANPGETAFPSFRLDLVVFDRAGTIIRRLALDVGPLRAAKTSVKVFDIADAGCATIGSMLVNDVIECRDASGAAGDCVERIATSSKLGVSLLK